jgi:hypothetical protein
VKWSQQFGREEILIWNFRFIWRCRSCCIEKWQRLVWWVVTNFSDGLLVLFLRWKYPEDWECRFLPLVGGHIGSPSGTKFKKCSIRLVLCELLIFTVMLDIEDGKVGRDELWNPQIFKLFCSMSQLHETYRKNESFFFVYNMLALQPVARLQQPPGVVVEWVGLSFSSGGGSLRQDLTHIFVSALRPLTGSFL